MTEFPVKVSGNCENGGFSTIYPTTLTDGQCHYQEGTGWLSELGCTRLAAARDKVYQLLVHVRWFSPVLRLLPPLKLVAMI